MSEFLNKSPKADSESFDLLDWKESLDLRLAIWEVLWDEQQVDSSHDTTRHVLAQAAVDNTGGGLWQHPPPNAKFPRLDFSTTSDDSSGNDGIRLFERMYPG
jgi:hypothetical protein